MREAFFIGFVFLGAAIFVSVSYWVILNRIARADGITKTEVLNNLFRPDLDQAKLAPWRVNLLYQWKVRRCVPKGPNKEPLEMSSIQLTMPYEDFTFIQNHGGVSEYARQLAEYRHRKLSDKVKALCPDLVPIRITMDSNLKRLRPKVDPEFAKQSDSTRPISDFLTPEHTAALDPSMATVRYEGTAWELTPAEAPYTFGRSLDNHVRINFNAVSKHHGEFRFENGRWILATLGSSNPTLVNGAAISGSTFLQSGDTITVGTSSPITFEAVFTVPSNSDDTTEKLP